MDDSKTSNSVFDSAMTPTIRKKSNLVIRGTSLMFDEIRLAKDEENQIKSLDEIEEEHEDEGSSDILLEFLHSDDRDYDSIRMDPVVDFDPNSQSDDEDQKEFSNIEKGTSNSQQHEDDFKLHTLIPNLDIEIHAAQTPTPIQEYTHVISNTNSEIPSSSFATMESLEYFKIEDNNSTGLVRDSKSDSITDFITESTVVKGTAETRVESSHDEANVEGIKPQTEHNNIFTQPPVLDISGQNNDDIYMESNAVLLDTIDLNVTYSNQLEIYEVYEDTDNDIRDRTSDTSISKSEIPNIFVTEYSNVEESSTTSDYGPKQNDKTMVKNFDTEKNFRSLTLEIEGNFKTNPTVQHSSVWDNSSNRRLIRRSTIEGIKDYFDTLDRLERNSVSFISKNRRSSLPLSATIITKSDDVQKEYSVKNCIDQTTADALRQYFCMIETIPQKTFEEDTIFDKQKQRQAVRKKDIDILGIDSDITPCFQRLNLDRTDVSLTYDTSETWINTLIQKENLVDTNNNTNSIIDFQLLNEEHHNINEHCEPLDKCCDNIEVKSNSEQTNCVAVSIELVAKQESSLFVDNILSNEAEVTELSPEIISLNHSSRPLILRPILKNTNEKDSVSSIIQLNKGSIKDCKDQRTYNNSKLSSVTFLLPPDLNSVHNYKKENTMISEKNNLIQDDSKEINVSNTSEVDASFNDQNSGTHIEMCQTKKYLLQMSPPSSFSDSDLSENENFARENNLHIKNIDDMMKPPMNVEEGGRYSILNPDFSSKINEKSTWMAEIENIRSEIISQKDKCIMDMKKWNTSTKLEENRKSTKYKFDNGEDSSGESTDTLLEEARQYVNLAKEKLVTLEDWKIIDQNKRKIRKKVLRVTKIDI